MASNTVGSLKVLLGLDAAEFVAGFSKADQAASKFADKQKRNAAAIDKQISSLEKQAALFGRSAREIKLYELAQRGATEEQLRAFDATTRQIEGMQALGRTISGIKMAAIGAGIAAAGAAAYLFGRSVADAVVALDDLNDVSDATGASVEAISGLDQIARRTGGSIETVETSLVKLNTALRDTDPDSGPSRVLRAIGLDAKALRDLDPAEALRRVAVAFSGFASDGERARAIQELLGKSAKELAPFLKDVAENINIVGTTSARQAEEAEKFRKSLFEFKTTVEDLTRSLVNGFLPSLNENIRLFREAAGVGGGLVAVYRNIRRQQLEALGIDKLSEESDSDRATRIANVTRLLAEQNLPMERRLRLESQLRDLQAKSALALPGMTAEESNNEISRLKNRSSTALPRLSVPEKKSSSSDGAKKIDEAAKYLESLKRQLQSVEELSIAERALIEIQSGRLGKATDQQQQQILLTAQQIDNAKSAKAAEEEITKAREASDESLKTIRLGRQKDIEDIEEQNKKLREEIAVVEGGEKAKRQLEEAQIASAISLREETVARLESINAAGDEIAQTEQQIKLLREQQHLLGLKSQAEDMKEARKSAEEFGKKFEDSAVDAFASFIDGSKSAAAAFRSFADSVAQQITRLAAQKLAESVFGTGAGGGAGGFGQLANLAFGALFGSSGGISVSTSGVGVNNTGVGIADLGLGGGRAYGGPVRAGASYRVAERGPELLDMNGRQFLLMGPRGGRVTPVDQAVRNPAGGMSNNITVNIPQSTSRASGNQIAGDIIRKLQQNRRNV